jgi:citrate/tricarballylate utilization protein
VPKVFGQLRAKSYAAYAWPRAFAGLFARNGLVIAVIAALSVAVFIAGFVAWHDPAALFAVHSGPGAFYRLMPHNTMVAIFGAVFAYAMLAMLFGARAFWRDIAEPVGPLREPASIWQAVKDAATLRYLDGGGVGCYNADERPTDPRRIYHHFTFYGFLLCFASTSTATLYHYIAGHEAPYAWWELPVVLGTLGGIGLIIGPVGLLAAKTRRDPAMIDRPSLGMDVAFLVMLFLTSLTGLALLGLRETGAMGMLLALHLGVVFALFFTFPYGKFVHGLYRFLALVRYAREKRMMAGGHG